MNRTFNARPGRAGILRLVPVLILAATASCKGPSAPGVQNPPANPHAPYDAVGRNGMVVAAHPLAVEAGLSVLRSGGNAVDAAVAASFALNASEPFASGIGGGGFMLLYSAKHDKIAVIDFRERAPRAARPEMYEEKGKERDEWRSTSGLAVGVPGALAGWDLALRRYGTRRLADLMGPALDIAEKGLTVGKNFCAINKEEYERLQKNAGEGTCYLNGGLPYEPGEVLRNPDLVRTLKLIAEKGIDEFYRGELARKTVEAVKAAGGIMTLEDLASYRAAEVEPIKGTYRDTTVYAIPPPGSGLSLIELLNIVENWPLRTWGADSPALIHHLSEAMGFVFADRDRYLGDPDTAAVPVVLLISKSAASRIAAAVRPDRVLGDYPFAGFEKKDESPGNTTHLCVADKNGNIVALTQSINDFFGSGIVPAGTGFLLNNQLKDFYPSPGSPNSPGSKRRPASSMSPAILFRNGKPFLALGSPGGIRIVPTLARIITNIVDFKMPLDAAIEAPRFFFTSSTREAKDLSVEPRVPESTLKELERLGHSIVRKDAWDRFFGGAHGIMIDRINGVFYGGADSRRDGIGKGI